MYASVFVRRSLLLCCLAIIVLSFGATRVAAHAILEKSTPAINSTVTKPTFAITLTFNVRIDASRSQLRLLFPNASLADLSARQTSPDSLDARVSGLKPGSYTILWQVLAPDGHITRGEIPFKVANP